MEAKNLIFYGRRYLIYENGGIATQNGKLLVQRISNKGYLIVDLTDECGITKHIKVHRLVALAYLPNPDNKPDVNHKDFNKFNNTVSNLEWITCRDNIHYSLANDPKYGLNRDRPGQRGSLNKFSKLNETQVTEIKRLLRCGSSPYTVARKYQVSRCAIRDIKTGRTWKHLDT